MRSPAGRVAIVLGTVAVVVALFFVLRATGDEEPAARLTVTEGTTPTTDAPTVSIEVGDPRRRILVSVRRGGVVGGVQTVRLQQGQRVVLVVRADVSDHVHLHGYERMADVGPGRPAQIGLRATIAGRFEVELEDRKLRILELEVRP